jgi:molybdopterin converting factor small subunit
MIRVKVKAYAELQGYNPEKGEEFIQEIDEGANIGNLLDSLKVPDHRVMLILRNGRKAAESAPLADGDAVTLLPVVGGG